MNNNLIFLLLIQLLNSSIYLINGRFITTKIGPQPIWNFTQIDKLRQDLLLNYDKFARPAQHYNATTVNLGFSLRHFELNEVKSTITVYALIRLTWDDDKLKWNFSDYGVDMLNMADHEIWQPDIVLQNSATTTAISVFGNAHILVWNTGKVLWVPPSQLTVFCHFNFKYWPFDSHECTLKFGSWTYSGDKIDLQILNNKIEAETDLLISSSEWQLLETKLIRRNNYYNCCAEPYPDINLIISLKRNSPSYKALIITPAFVVVILTLLNFWLPPEAGEKIVLNSCNAIIISLFMLYFAQRVPAMGTDTPLIVLFYSTCLYMIGFSMIVSVLVIWLAKTKHSNALPWMIKKPLIGSIGKIFCLNVQKSFHSTAEEMRDFQEEHQIIKSLQQDWILLATAIDRLLFCFYCFLFLIILITYLI